MGKLRKLIMGLEYASIKLKINKDSSILKQNSQVISL